MSNLNHEFLEAYKDADNICKQIYASDKGITNYIDAMTAIPSYESVKISDWSAVLSRLKNLRHIRNKLSHEVGTLDMEMCTQADINWIRSFKLKIINQDDPLASLERLNKKTNTKTRQTASTSTHSTRPSRFAVMFYTAFILIVAAIIAGIVLLVK